MIVKRSLRFDADFEGHFAWYLLEAGLDLHDALVLAERFTEAVELTLETLAQNPGIGRRRFAGRQELAGVRSKGVQKPFGRFIIFYRCERDVLFAERLLEGHSRLAATG